MKFISSVEQHYHRENLYDIILNKLQELGITSATRKDIAGVDEFHIRGAAVSMELAKEAGFYTDCKVLDIGCGIGGPCRMLADEFGCNVTGIDITEEFIETARQLTKLVGLEGKATFLKADALNLPFEDMSFDFAWTQHVQMNISDKATFYSEMARVLKPGGKFIYYDFFARNQEPLRYPVPWADDQSISHLITTAESDAILKDLGFHKVNTENQTQKGIDFFEKLFASMAKGEATAIGLPLLIGVSSKEKFQNLYKNILDKKLDIQSGIFRKND
jgi:SAM-dependent methyltransferase